MTIIEGLLQWLQGCPLVEGCRIGVNYLGAQPLEFAVLETPAAPALRRYQDGSALCRKAFALAAVQDYSCDTLANTAAAGLWEALEEWVAGRNQARDFPSLGPGRVPRSIEVTATHGLLQTTANTGRYQIQLALTYYQKGAR